MCGKMNQKKHPMLISNGSLRTFIYLALLTISLCSPVLGYSEAPASHLNGSSIKLSKSGIAQVGQRMPFFSGWLTNGQVLNLSRLLKKKKQRYVVSMCASWCEPCFDGLKAISNAKALFQKRGIEVVIYVADTETAAHKLDKQFNFGWASVLIDEFKSHARKLSTGKKGSKKGTLELPRTFVFDQNGNVEIIIGQEGQDYIQLLLGAGE